MDIAARPIAERTVLHDKSHRKRVLRHPSVPCRGNMFGGKVAKTARSIPKASIRTDVAYGKDAFVTPGIAQKGNLVERAYIEWFELDAAPDYENVVNSMEQTLVEKFKLV